MAEKKELIAGAANPKRGMPTEMRVAEIGSNEKEKYTVEIGKSGTMNIPKEIRDSEIQAYPGGTTSARKEGDEKGK